VNRFRSDKAVPQGWGMTQRLRNLRKGQSFIYMGKRNGLYALAKQARVKIATRRLPDSLTGAERYEIWRVA
jgi:hypothetical protein